MRHDIENCGTMSEAYPHLIFNNFTSKLGKRCTDILKYLFPVPKEDSKRVITFANEEDYILFRHYVYKKSAENKSEIELTEVGPRFDLKRKCFFFLFHLHTFSIILFLVYEIKLGTLDNAETADSEWRLKPFMNTSKKKQALAIE